LSRIAKNFPVWNYHYSKILPAVKDARILDIGCGDGNFVYWFHALGYANAGGIDISREQIDAGNKMGIKNLFCGDLKEFLLKQDDQYDLIVARDVIEHFTKDEVFEILFLVNKHLQPGGKFVIQVPNGEGYFYTSIFYGDYTHEAAYTAGSVNQIALNTGYSASSCKPVGPAPIGFVSAVRFLLWKLKVMQLKFWKMVETGNPHGIFTQNLIAVLIK
jgi:SAM-dependent methyltransferase